MINPVFRRETRTSLRSWKIFAAMSAYTGILTLVAAVTLAISESASYNYSFNPQNVMILYIALTAFQNLIVAIIVPSLTASAISGERERQTLDLMLLTKMSTGSIVIGKLLSSMLTIVLIIVASLPVFSIVFYFGGVSLLNLLGMMLFTLLFAAMTGSISIFFSTVTKKTIVSTVWTYIVLLAITLGNLTVAGVSAVLFEQMPDTAVSNLVVYGLLALNPGVAFASLADMQMNTGLFADMFNSMYYGYSGGALQAAVDFIVGIPLWVPNLLAMGGITAVALLASARLIKPVRDGK